MWSIQILFAIILSTTSGQLYFPDDSGGLMQMPLSVSSTTASSALKLATNLTELRGTAIYDKLVEHIISSGILKLSLDVERSLITTTPKDYNSIVYSPVNIAGALALILLGSNGKTFEEIATIMGLATGVDIQSNAQRVHEQFGRMLDKLQTTSGFDIGHQVSIATAIFVQNQYPIRQIYKQTAESVYDSEVFNVDFASNPGSAQQVINAWVSERTKGKINDILNDTPSGATKVILASAMYFKSEWEKPFFDGITKKLPFYTNGRKAGSEVMVEMMSNGGFFPYYKDTSLDCEIIGFPHKGNQTTMYVVIPSHSNQEKLKQLQMKLTNSIIENLVSKVKYTGVIVVFPKMKIDTTINLRKTLQTMGVKSLFDPVHSNLALLSPGVNSMHVNPVIGESIQNPVLASNTGNEVIIFSRSGEAVNCTQIFNPNSDINSCEEVVSINGTNSQGVVTYKKFGNKIGRRINRKITPRIVESLDTIRKYLKSETLENPGLYADTVIHKVYMDITESGTEAAASTSASLSRNGGRTTVRVDVPFFFFIMHEETKTVMFWGSVNTPTPNFR